MYEVCSEDGGEYRDIFMEEGEYARQLQIAEMYIRVYLCLHM